MRRRKVQASVTNPDMLKDIAKKFGGEYKKAGGVNGLYQAVEFNQDGNRVTVAPFEQVKQGKLIKSYLNVTVQLNTDSDSDDDDEDNSDSFKIDLIKDAGLESNEYQSCETTILNVMGKSSKRILGLISALAQQSVDVQSSLKGGSMRRQKVQASPISYKDFTTCVKMCKGLKVYESDENEVMCGLDGGVISLAIVDDNTVRAVTWDDTDNESAKDLEISTLYNQRLLSRSLQDLCNKSGYSSEETKVAVRGALKFLQSFYDKVSPNFDEESSLKGGTIRRRKVESAKGTSNELTKNIANVAKQTGGTVNRKNPYEVRFGDKETGITVEIDGNNEYFIMVDANGGNNTGTVKTAKDAINALNNYGQNFSESDSYTSEEQDELDEFKDEAINFVTQISDKIAVQSSLKGGNMKVLSRAQAQRKLLALAGIRKVTQSLIALAEADEDEQDDLQEEVQDAVEELLENPSDDIEEAIEDITSAMKRNHRVVSGEDDAFYDEDIVDLSEADEGEDLEDDVVESRFRSRKVQSRMQRKRNVMAELDEEFDGAYADDITDESDLDEDIYDEDSYEEVSSSKRRNRSVGAKTRTSVKSSKVAGKRKATASIVAANLAALRNM
jgi:hypothetical protein